MSRLALCDTRGPLTDLLEKLSGEGGEQWLVALNRFLRRENPWAVWQTIKLTGIKDADGFRQAFVAANMKISGWANGMMSKPEFAASLIGVNPHEEFDLVVRTTAELVGEDRGGTLGEIFAGADRLGLKKCSAWMGPVSRLVYKDQPDGEWLNVGMDSIRGLGGVLLVFLVGCDSNGLWLSGSFGPPDWFWSAPDRWVFVCPRKCQQVLDS